jgi:hypothetical protein
MQFLKMPNSVHVDVDTKIGDIKICFGKGELSQINLQKILAASNTVTKKIENGIPHSFDINRLKPLHIRGRRDNIMSLMINTNMRRNFMPHILYDKKNCRQYGSCISACGSDIIKVSDNDDIVINKKNAAGIINALNTVMKNRFTPDGPRLFFWTHSIHSLAKNTETKVITF